MTDSNLSTSFTTTGLKTPSDKSKVPSADGKVDEVETPTKPQEQTSRLPRVGTYVLQLGDTPSSVARSLFGRGSRGRDLVKANAGVKWVPGVEITIPND